VTLFTSVVKKKKGEMHSEGKNLKIGLMHYRMNALIVLRRMGNKETKKISTQQNLLWGNIVLLSCLVKGSRAKKGEDVHSLA